MAVSMACSRAFTAAPTHAILAATEEVTTAVVCAMAGVTAANMRRAAETAIVFLSMVCFFGLL
jgi:hypothetical protein